MKTLISKFITFGIAALLLTNLTACFEKEAKARLTSIPIFTGTFKNSVEAKGYVKPIESFPIITPRIWGTIEELIPEGTKVKKGDLIAKINVREFLERFNDEFDYLNQEKITYQKQRADLPFQLVSLDIQLKEKENALKQRKLDYELLKQGETEDKIVGANKDIQVSNLKINNLSLDKKTQLYKKGYISKKELNDSNLEYETLVKDLKKNKISKEQLNPEYRIYDVSKASLQKDQAKEDLKINQMEIKARKSSLKVESVNNKFKVKGYEIRARRLENRIKMADIYSPMDGVVIYPLIWNWKKPHVGMEVWNGFSFLNVSQIDKKKIEAQVNELEIVNVKAGLPVEITIDSYPNKIFKGKVSKVGKLAKYLNEYKPEGLKYFDVDIEVLEKLDTLKTNMTVNIKIINDNEKNSFYIPIEALVEEKDKNYVFFDENGKPTKKLVNIQTRSREFIVLKGNFTGKEKFFIPDQSLLGKSES